MTAYEFMCAEKASGARKNWPVAAMCRALGVSRSGYHDFRTRQPSTRTQRRVALTAEVKAVYRESGGRYGAPRVTRTLRNKGKRVARKTIAKLMAAEGLAARRKKRFKKTTDSRLTVRVAPNLLKRDFGAAKPNTVWVTDVTALFTRNGWVYLAAIIDLFSRRVVGWATSEQNDTALILLALRRAVFQRKPPRGIIHHSDRGSPYASDDYITELRRFGFRRSMSRKGDCWDNAVAESFFSTLEFECVMGQIFPDAKCTERVVAGFIDGFYNPSRLHSTLGHLSPIEYELTFQLKSQSA